MLKPNILTLNPEIVCSIILRAKEFQVQEETDTDEVIPDSEYESDWAQILSMHEDDMTYIELRKTIDDLEPDQQVELLALMYLGRGDFEQDDWSEAHKEAKRNLAPHLGRYLLAKPSIADDLARGLEMLGHTCEE